jgi:hypothetical protein
MFAPVTTTATVIPKPVSATPNPAAARWGTETMAKWFASHGDSYKPYYAAVKNAGIDGEICADASRRGKEGVNELYKVLGITIASHVYALNYKLTKLFTATVASS